MSIYRILPPVGIAAGDRIGRDTWMDDHNGNSLIGTDSDELCDTIRHRRAGKCSARGMHFG